MEDGDIRIHQTEIADDCFRSDKSNRDVSPPFGGNARDHNEAPLGHVFDVKSGRCVGEFPGPGADAGEPEFLDRRHSLDHFRHRAEFVGRAVSEPETPAFPTVDELLRPEPAPEPLLRLRFDLDEGIALFGREKVVAIVDRLIPDADLGYVAQRLAPVHHDRIVPLHEVRADVLRDRHGRICLVPLVVVDALRARGLAETEADDDDVDVRLAAGFALPRERPVCEKDLRTPAEKFSPENPDLLPLADAVRGDEADGGFRVLHIVGRLEVPGANVVEQADVLQPLRDRFHFGPLLGTLELGTDERRIPDYVGAFAGRKYVVPVEMQCISVADRGRFLQG